MFALEQANNGLLSLVTVSHNRNAADSLRQREPEQLGSKSSLRFCLLAVSGFNSRMLTVDLKVDEQDLIAQLSRKQDENSEVPCSL